MTEAVRSQLSIGEIAELLAALGGWEQLRRRHCFYIGQMY